MTDSSVALPEGIEIAPFKPVAYYDKHMDCIRVVTHDRSVTEHRIDSFITIHECNHRGQHDPQYVGFTIKGIHYLFEQIGRTLEGVLRLTDLIDEIVRHQPESTMSIMLSLISRDQEAASDLEIDFKEAA